MTIEMERTEPWFKMLATERPVTVGGVSTSAPIEVAAVIYNLARSEWGMNEVPEKIVGACQQLLVDAGALEESMRQIGALVDGELGASPPTPTPGETERADTLTRSGHRPPAGG